MNSQNWYIILNGGNSVYFKSCFILEYISVQPVFLVRLLGLFTCFFLSCVILFTSGVKPQSVNMFLIHAIIFYLKTSLCYFRPAFQDSHPNSSSQASANAIYIQPAIDWGQYISSKGCQMWWKLGLVHCVGVRPRRTHIMVRKCLVVSLAGSKKCKF